MSVADIDPDILQDFLTESDELLSSMDSLLVELESRPTDDDLLNTIFRALHTIKGSSGFLGLPNVTELAHASEDLLNKLRNAELVCDEAIVTAILQSVDVLRVQIEQVGEGQEPNAADTALLGQLHALTNSEQAQDAASGTTESVSSSTPMIDGMPTEAIALDGSKSDLLEFMVLDLAQTLEQLNELHEQTLTPESRPSACAEAAELAGELTRSVDFFERDQLTGETRVLVDSYTKMSELPEACVEPLRARLGVVQWVMSKRLEALGSGCDLLLQTETLVQLIDTLLETQDPGTLSEVASDATPEEILVADGVFDPEDVPSQRAGDAADAEGSSADAKPAAQSAQATATKAKPAGEQTIRVDVDRLESLLNLVGELVLQKNRVVAISRSLGVKMEDHEDAEAFVQVASDLDRITGELQVGVMKTRLQPLNKLFNRYPRVIRDLAHATGKQIRLELDGGETEVDKSVIELLADPMVHIMRNSADHGIESPEKREEAGKPTEGVIRLAAQHEGSHVVVTIADDGGGIDPEKVAKKAVANGMMSESDVQNMTDAQLVRLVFAPGFSTAEGVSDLSGRGVGMDVVNTNITKLNGVVDVMSEKGVGTTVTIKIPLTLAIMQALMIRVNHAIYAVPLTNILEIVQPSEETVSTVGGRKVMRLRDRVIPLLELPEMLPGTEAQRANEPDFVVTVAVGTDSAGLMVHGLLGQQDIVIKPLDEMFARGGNVSGATVREDGQVSMILDVASLITHSQRQAQAA